MDARIDSLLAELTLDEKVSLTAGVDMWHTPAVERVGVPAFRMTDGPVGARGTVANGGPRSACFPCGTALAATWDVALVHRVGQELAAEARLKGAHLLLAPTVNIHRGPLAGRNFECYSEDPILTARMAVAYISGVQAGGVGACIKHLVANDSEYERFTMSSEVPERALREIYLRPFEIAMRDAHPVAVMAAYNKLGGTWCSEHPELLTTILRDEWGYDGLVVSDWWATHTTEASFVAGCDVEMPGPTLYRGEQLVAAVRSGSVSEADVDRSVRRVLLAMARTGALDGDGGGTEVEDDDPERRGVMRRAAGEAIVLLRNEPVDGAPVLPLAPGIRRLAIVGPNADALTILGGGSAAVSPHRSVTILDALREALPGVEVTHEAGCSIARSVPSVDPRWLRAGDEVGAIAVDYVHEPSGTVVARHLGRRAAFAWPLAPVPELTGEAWSARLSATLTVPVSGSYRLQLRRAGRARLFLDGELVLDGWDDDRVRLQATLALVAGAERELAVEYVPPPDGRAGLDVRLGPPVVDDAMARAVRAAAEADAVVIVVGTDGDWETEGRDRTTMDLPAPQDELIRQVSAVNPRTVVVVNAGAPVTMDWVDDVPAALQIWFGGQEQGPAVADVLTGRRNPSGRLPTTIPVRLRDTPAYTNYPGEHGAVLYGEGVFVGYRWYEARGIAPRFPFGHGLSYTRFSYGPVALDAPAVTTASPAVVARVRVRNDGDVAGAEVVQLYVRDVEASVARPEQELAAFARVELAPGEEREVELALDADAFGFWDPTAHAWRIEPGEFELRVGASSADIRSRATLVVSG